MDPKSEVIKSAVEIATKLGALFLVLYVSYLIVRPFLPLIVWGMVLAVAFEPLVALLEGRLGGRKRVVLLLSFMAIALLVVPAWMLSDSFVESARYLMSAIGEKRQLIPPPTENIKEWPLIGEKIYALWNDMQHNLKEALAPFGEQIREGILKIVTLLKSGIGALLLTIASVIVAAFFLIAKERSTLFYHRVLRRLLGKRGDEWADLSVLTVRSVATGVVGVAIIQSAFALPGMILMGVPLAPLWALAIMFLTIIQLPALIVIGPIIAYVYTYAEGTPATLFALYMLLVGASDGILKPMLMGRGVEIPMPVILVGAIGGMMLMGMLGLFIGAVILALAYKLFGLWMSELEEEERPETQP